MITVRTEADDSWCWAPGLTHIAVGVLSSGAMHAAQYICARLNSYRAKVSNTTKALGLIVFLAALFLEPQEGLVDEEVVRHLFYQLLWPNGGAVDTCGECDTSVLSLSAACTLILLQLDLGGQTARRSTS